MPDRPALADKADAGSLARLAVAASIELPAKPGTAMPQGGIPQAVTDPSPRVISLHPLGALSHDVVWIELEVAAAVGSGDSAGIPIMTSRSELPLS